jgi:RND family efflux transporter MFP subunit
MPAKRKSHKRLLAMALIAASLGTFSLAHMVSRAHGGWTNLLEQATGRHAEATTEPIEPQRVVAEGRLATYPGDEVLVSSETSGRIVRLVVAEKQLVGPGDLIAEIESAELQAAADEWRSRLIEFDADVRLAEIKVQQVSLLSSKAISTLERAERQRDLETANARKNAAAASLAQIEAQLAKTKILSPIGGQVISRFTHAGQMVQPGNPVVTVANLSRLRVEAEVNEFDGGKLIVGAPVTITAEGFPDMSWRGQIEEVPDVVTARQLRPQDPGRPSDTGIILAKVRILEPTPLKLSQRVEVSIETPGN